jgi:hypothetical protein
MQTVKVTAEGTHPPPVLEPHLVVHVSVTLAAFFFFLRERGGSKPCKLDRLKHKTPAQHARGNGEQCSRTGKRVAKDTYIWR